MPHRSLHPTSLGLSLLCGLSSPAVSQTRHPVIAKVEIMFSLVSHYSHISERVSFYNGSGIPKGNINYAVPHLVYEPAVTLYNPYNEPLTMARSRIKIWDPPVGFTFKKNDVFLREDFANGIFHGLARFQVGNDANASARKSLTLSLSSPTATGNPGDQIVLQPGESKTFSCWVEKDWTWGVETAGGFTPRSFFDWNPTHDFTNRDNRTQNAFGIETLANGYPYFTFDDPRAGYQTDWLSQGNGLRPPATLYSFENPARNNDGWVAVKLTDTIGLQAKSMRTVSASAFPNAPDFQIDLLRGQAQNPATDRVKAFPMSLAGIIQNDQNPVISRTFRASDLLQSPNDRTTGGKSTIAKLIMIAKSGALRANRFYTTPATPTGELYELHFTETMDFNTGDPAAPSDASTITAPQVHGVSRSGNTLFIDFTGIASPYGTKNWFVRGTTSLADGFPDDLTSSTTVIKSMSASGIYKAIIDLTGRGERYFVRIEG